MANVCTNYGGLGSGYLEYVEKKLNVLIRNSGLLRFELRTSLNNYPIESKLEVRTSLNNYSDELNLEVQTS